MPDLYCELCNMASCSDGHFKRHFGSVSHKKMRLIRQLLEKNCIRHVEIAKRVGVSREWIRQIANRLEFPTGRMRRSECRISRVQAQFKPSRFFVACAERGMNIHMLSVNSGYVNGHLCVHRKATYRKGRLARYITIHQPVTLFQVCAFELNDGRFLILSGDKMIFASTTMFTLEEPNGNCKGAYSKAHHYRDYIDRWDTLETDSEGTHPSG